MEEKFFKYNSMENTYRTDFIDKVRPYIKPDINQWYITEKIHGCNTQISYDGKKIEIGKRTGLVQENENFYNAQKVLKPLEDKIKRLYKRIMNYTCGFDKVIIFGELFGGDYKHPDVPPCKNATKVQKGVYYTPDNNFLAFDIAYTVDENIYYLSGEVFLAVTEELKIPTVPVLATKLTLGEALEYKNDGESVVYKMYNLPKIEGNIMEGVVIKNLLTDLWVGQHRVFFKNKNEKFKEISHSGKKVVVQIDPKIQEVANKVLAYVTPQRVQNVMSHMGEVTYEQIGEVLKNVTVDVFEDFEKENNDFNTLEKNEIKLVKKTVNPHIVKLVKNILLGGANV